MGKAPGAGLPSEVKTGGEGASHGEKRGGTADVELRSGDIERKAC